MTTGLRFALDPGTGDAAVPSRSLVVGAVVAITALVGAVTFGASLTSLVDEPRLYGWNWDAVVLGGNGYGNLEPAATRAALDDQRYIAARAGAYFGSDTIDGVDTPLLGMEPGVALSPPLTAGRPLAGPDEVVLGAATASDLGKEIGDRVRVGSRNVRVVGIATMPTIGIIHAAHPSLGVGALVVPELVPGYDRDITDQFTGSFGPNAIFVRFEPGADHDIALARLRRASEPLTGFAGLDVLPVQRPAEIVNASSVRSVPVLLAGALALGTAVSLALALATSVRRRRRDLAVLRTVGFTSRQLTRAVSWQATVVVVLGLVVGVPLGIALGRVLWARFADQLDVLSQPTIPAVVVTVISAGALLVGILAAALPARAARRISAPALLRSE
jgi:ABC-type antimicrobial peptide transport system permease subunit